MLMKANLTPHRSRERTMRCRDTATLTADPEVAGALTALSERFDAESVRREAEPTPPTSPL